MACLEILAHRGGFEPPTPRFVVWCSIQLSYRCFGCRGRRIRTVMKRIAVLRSGDTCAPDRALTYCAPGGNARDFLNFFPGNCPKVPKPSGMPSNWAQPDSRYRRLRASRSGPPVGNLEAETSARFVLVQMDTAPMGLQEFGDDGKTQARHRPSWSRCETP